MNEIPPEIVFACKGSFCFVSMYVFFLFRYKPVLTLSYGEKTAVLG